MIRGSGGLQVGYDGSGFAVSDARPRWFVARIDSAGTANASGVPYAWTEMQAAPAGGFSVKPGGRTGTASRNSGYEINNTPTRANTIVLMWERGFTSIDTGPAFEFVQGMTPECCPGYLGDNGSGCCDFLGGGGSGGGGGGGTGGGGTTGGYVCFGHCVWGGPILGSPGTNTWGYSVYQVPAGDTDAVAALRSCPYVAETSCSTQAVPPGANGSVPNAGAARNLCDTLASLNFNYPGWYPVSASPCSGPGPTSTIGGGAGGGIGGGAGAACIQRCTDACVAAWGFPNAACINDCVKARCNQGGVIVAMSGSGGSAGGGGCSGCGGASSASVTSSAGGCGCGGACGGGAGILGETYLGAEALGGGHIDPETAYALTLAGTPSTGVASWSKHTLSYSDFASGSVSASLTLAALAGGQTIEGVAVLVGTNFTGGGTTSCSLDISDITGFLPGYLSAYDVKTTAGAYKLGASGGATAWTDVAAAGGVNLLARLNVNLGKTTGDLTAGSVDIWLKTTTLA